VTFEISERRHGTLPGVRAPTRMLRFAAAVVLALLAADAPAAGSAVAAETSGLAASGAAQLHGAQAGGDPLQSDECRRALDALQAREASAGPQAHADRGAAQGQADAGWPDRRGARASDPRLETARHLAALACLANRPDPPRRPSPEAPPARLAMPPVAVPPLSLARPAATALPRPTPLTPIVPITPRSGSRPQFITSCDAGGCWADDGSRLNRVGPNLSAGSRGLCVQQGNLLTCP
jgi:hypothetical protein